jgi:hypothetical protein
MATAPPAMQIAVDAFCITTSRAASMGRNSHPASFDTATEDQKGTDLGKNNKRSTRISISISLEMQDWMSQECSRQGRSLSNLASYWVKQKAEALALEQGIQLAGH